MKQKVSAPTQTSGICITSQTSPKVPYLAQLLKWAPLLSLVTLDATGKQQQEKLEKHLIELAAAMLIMNATLLPSRLLSGCNTPADKATSSAARSTATTFLGSEMLRQELAPRHPEWSYAGYLLAAGATALKAGRRKNVWSKALAGAAIGVLAVKLTPMLLDKIIARVNIQQAVY